MPNADASENKFKHYITGYPLQEFHHKVLPEVFRPRDRPDDAPKAEDVSTLLVLVMTVFTLIPAWTWLFIMVRLGNCPET